MSAHTPGPWVVHFSRQGYPYQIHAPNGCNKTPGAVGSDITRWGAITLPSSAEGLANANLMAAAPLLLAALRLYIAWCEAEDDHSKGDFYERIEMFRAAETAARAAIAAAEGKP